jgi:hypothetical protein
MNTIEDLSRTAARPHRMPTKRDSTIITSLSESFISSLLSGANISFTKKLFFI